MKPFPRAAAALLALSLLPAAAHAQGPDARVLPRGVLELRAEGSYGHWRSLYDDGGTRPLGFRLDDTLGPLADRLVAAPQDSLQNRLARFFDGTGVPAPEAVTAGTYRLDLTADTRWAPISLAYGLSRRITVEATVPIQRRGTVVEASVLDGTTFGINPNATRNAQLLGRIDASYASLGAGAFLPLAESPAGIALQNEVRERLGDSVSLLLPTFPVGLNQLLGDAGLRAVLQPEEIAALGLGSSRTNYRMGDAVLSARFLLVGDAGWSAADSASPQRLRATVAGRVRLPTGEKDAIGFVHQLPPEQGHAGVGGTLLADYAISSRWWVSAAAGMDVLFPADVQRLAFTDTEPLPDVLSLRTVRRVPGARLSLDVVPRWRLTREVSFAAHYALRTVAATEFEDADGWATGPLENTDAYVAQSAGIGARYSSLEAWAAGRAGLPFELSVRYDNAFAGSGLAPDASVVTVGGRLFYQLTNRPRRPEAEVAPPPPPPPAPPAPSPPPVVPEAP